MYEYESEDAVTKDDLTLEEWREKFGDVAAWLDRSPSEAGLDPDDPSNWFTAPRLAWAWAMLPGTYFEDIGYEGRSPIDHLRLINRLQTELEDYVPRAVNQSAHRHGWSGERIANAAGMDLIEMQAAWLRWAWRRSLDAYIQEHWPWMIEDLEPTARKLGVLAYWQTRQTLPGPDDVPAAATIAGELRTR